MGEIDSGVIFLKSSDRFENLLHFHWRLWYVRWTYSSGFDYSLFSNIIELKIQDKIWSHFQQELTKLVQSAISMGNWVLDFLVHLSEGLVESVGLEYRIPAKFVITSRAHYSAFSDSFEKHYVIIRRESQSEDAHCLGLFIIEGMEKFRKSVYAQFLQKEFTKISIAYI